MRHNRRRWITTFNNIALRFCRDYESNLSSTCRTRCGHMARTLMAREAVPAIHLPSIQLELEHPWYTRISYMPRPHYVNRIWTALSLLQSKRRYVFPLKFLIPHSIMKVNIATCHRRLYSTILAEFPWYTEALALKPESVLDHCEKLPEFKVSALFLR